MKAFMLYISYEMLVMYVATALLYIGGTIVLVVAIYLRGEILATAILAPLLLISWAGLLAQVARVAEASSDMRRYVRSNES